LAFVAGSKSTPNYTAAFEQTFSRTRKARLCVYRTSFSSGSFTMIDIVTIQPLVALIFGILILFIPRALNYLVAIYLILVGIMGLYPHFAHTLH
jgi:hypothetical protein